MAATVVVIAGLPSTLGDNSGEICGKEKYKMCDWGVGGGGGPQRQRGRGLKNRERWKQGWMITVETEEYSTQNHKGLQNCDV